MSKSEYNIADIDDAILNVEKTKGDIDNSTSEIDNFIVGIDHRVKIHFYNDFTKQIRSNQRELEKDSENCNTFYGWLSNTRDELVNTISKTEGIANQAGNGSGIDGSLNNNSVGAGAAAGLSISALDSSIQETIGGLGSSDAFEYTFDPKAFEELPSEIQEVIKAKLEELGFTEDEIKDILDGKVPVSKLELDTLSGELEKVLKANPDIRTKLVELYGFDIFNEDGTINKDRLALAMIMDGKDPNDKYDLKEFLKKYQQNESTGNKPSTTTPTPTTGNEGDNNSDNNGDNNGDNTNTPNIIGGTIPNTSNDENNGTGSTGNTISNTHGTNDITNTSVDGVVSTDENGLSPDDTASSLTTSIEHGEILPTGNAKVKKGGMGAVAAMTGIGSAIAAAAGGTALAKKKKSENEEEEEDIELLTEERYMNDDDTDESEENDKDWLYGLGIGLAGGAGLSQILPDDDDDEDDDDSDELLSEDEFYPHF